MARRTIKTEAALAAHQVLRIARFCKRTVLQNEMGKRLGRIVDDVEFEAAIAQLKVIRVPGVGGGICLA